MIDNIILLLHSVCKCLDEHNVMKPVKLNVKGKDVFEQFIE